MAVRTTIASELENGQPVDNPLTGPLAFYAITSLGAVSLLQCYSLSLACVPSLPLPLPHPLPLTRPQQLLWRRLNKPETLPPAKFSLGKFGVPCNIAAVCYATWACFWCFWPQTIPVTAAGFNWASPIFAAAIIVSMLYFIFTARKTYVGPVTEVEGRKEHFR